MWSWGPVVLGQSPWFLVCGRNTQASISVMAGHSVGNKGWETQLSKPFYRCRDAAVVKATTHVAQKQGHDFSFSGSHSGFFFLPQEQGDCQIPAKPRSRCHSSCKKRVHGL